MDNKTPNKSIPIEQADERRLIGILPDGRGVQVIYARACIIDGFNFDIVEREFVVASDLVKLQGGDQSVIQALFHFALDTCRVSVQEIVRILNLRK